jgi:NAD(P)H-flavin reductase
MAAAHNTIARPGTATAIRITHSPLKEWHAFATIPEPERNEFSLIVSRAGDWTSGVIDNPPTKLWVRGIPTHGVLRIIPLFRRMILVATGSGIGPCANTIFEGRIPVRLLWTSPNVRETFGDEFVDQILRYAPDAILYGNEYDTSEKLHWY